MLDTHANGRVFRANSPDVVAEIIEGEAVLVHMGNGRYYSLQNSGAAAWSLLAAGAPEVRVAEALAAHYGVPAERLAGDLAALITQLQAEDLLVADPDAAADSVNGLTHEFGSQWETPQLQVYTDMEDLLLVDPIHEATDEGWPNRQ